MIAVFFNWKFIVFVNKLLTEIMPPEDWNSVGVIIIIVTNNLWDCFSQNRVKFLSQEKKRQAVLKGLTQHASYTAWIAIVCFVFLVDFMDFIQFKSILYARISLSVTLYQAVFSVHTVLLTWATSQNCFMHHEIKRAFTNRAVAMHAGYPRALKLIFSGTNHFFISSHQNCMKTLKSL